MTRGKTAYASRDASSKRSSASRETPIRLQVSGSELRLQLIIQWRRLPSSEYADVQHVGVFNATKIQLLNGCTDPSGPTFLTYTPNGKQLVTTGSNNVVRVYETGSDGEPTNLDDCQENNTAIAATVSFGAKRGLKQRIYSRTG